MLIPITWENIDLTDSQIIEIDAQSFAMILLIDETLLNLISHWILRTMVLTEWFSSFSLYTRNDYKFWTKYKLTNITFEWE
jgi:hypothetical protein